MRFDRKVIAAVALIVVGVGAVVFVIVGPGIFSSGTSQEFITATATTTDVVKQVTATGTVIDKATYGLTFGQPAEIVSSTGSTAASTSGSGGSTSWSVETVQVTVGQTVTAGQVLATADTSDLEAQVAIAEANLASVESKLEIDQAGATPENAAVAQDSVSQAELSYTSTLQSQKDAAAQSAVSVNAARAAVERARAQLAADQAGPSADEIASYQDQVNSAQLALTTAQQNLAQVQTQNAQAEKAAMDAVTNAQNQLAADQAGPSAAEIASYQDQVNSAQLALATAQQNLASVQAQNAQAESVAADAVTNALTQQWIDGCPGAPTPSPLPLQTPNPSPDPGKCDADQIALQNAENNLTSLQAKNAASLQQAQTQVAQAQQALTAAQNNYNAEGHAVGGRHRGRSAGPAERPEQPCVGAGEGRREPPAGADAGGAGTTGADRRPEQLHAQGDSLGGHHRRGQGGADQRHQQPQRGAGPGVDLVPPVRKPGGAGEPVGHVSRAQLRCQGRSGERRADRRRPGIGRELEGGPDERPAGACAGHPHLSHRRGGRSGERRPGRRGALRVRAGSREQLTPGDRERHRD